MNDNRVKKYVTFLFIGGVSLFYLLPFVLFGTNSVITIPGNLDTFTPWMRIFKENNLFFKINIPAEVFEKASIFYYPINCSFQSLIYSLFDDFTAYITLYCFSLVFAFFSMYLLLSKTLRLPFKLSLLVSVCYMILPVVPAASLSVHATLPFIIYSFFFLDKAQNRGIWKSCLLLFFPFFSNLTPFGILLCAVWLLAAVIAMIRDKKVNLNLLVGFICLCTGYVAVNLRSFYTLIVLKTAPKWSVLAIQPTETISGLGGFFTNFIECWIAGYHQAASMQRKLIFPLSFFVTAFLLVKTYFYSKNIGGTLFDKIKEFYKCMDREFKILLLLDIIVLCFSLLAVFGWVWIFNRVLWYIIFALCIYIITQELRKLSFVLSGKDSNSTVVLPELVLFLIAFLLILFQAGYIVSRKVYYNDVRSTWAHMSHVVRNIDDSYVGYISYKEYFSEDFFEKIKKDISYTDEKTAVLGYTPSVLMYNSFNCIAGYNPVEPGRNKYMEPVTLDPGLFKDRSNLVYVLSKAEIVNAGDLGLNLERKYEDGEGIYTVYLYRLLGGRS
jgi:hypothetical protein